MFDIRFHRIPRYISRCHQATIKRFDHDPPLSCNSCHSAMYIFEFSICNNGFIS